jgi:hypothetical protein
MVPFGLGGLDTLADVALEEVDPKLKEAVLEKVLGRLSLQRLGFTEETFDVAVSLPVSSEKPPEEASIVEALAAQATKAIDQENARNPVGIDMPSSTLQRDGDEYHLVLKVVPGA